MTPAPRSRAQARRYTRVAVPANSASRSASEHSRATFLRPFQSTRYESDIRSTGKFDSNMQRSRAEALDHVPVVAALRRDELVGSRRAVGLVPPESVVRHRQPSQLGDDVVAACDLRDVALPIVEDRVALRRVAADADRRAEMIEDHHRVGDCAREREELAVLVVVVPGVVRQAAGTESRDTGAKGRILEQSRGRAARDHEAVGRFGSRQRVTDAAEESASRFDVCVEHVVEIREPQIGVADDARDQPAAALRLGGDELRLADGRQRGRPVGAVGGAALHEHGVLDPVPAADVGEQVGEAVRQRSARPHVMVRIDDPLPGIDDRLVDERSPLVGAGDRRAHDRELYQLPCRRASVRSAHARVDTVAGLEKHATR